MDSTSEHIPSETIKDQFTTSDQDIFRPEEQKINSYSVILVCLFWYVIALIFSVFVYLPFAKSFLPTDAAYYILLFPFSVATPIYFVFFVWNTQIGLSASLAKRWAKILIFSVPTICLIFFILTFWLSDRPCESIVCAAAFPIIASAFFWTLVTAAIVPVAGARLLVKEPCDFKIFFTKSIIFGIPTLLLLFGVWSITSPRYEMLTETLRSNIQRLQEKEVRLKQLKSSGIFLDLELANLPKGVSKTFKEGSVAPQIKPDQCLTRSGQVATNCLTGIVRSYECLRSATTALSITQYPRSQQIIIEEDGGKSYEVRKRELTIADKQGMLYEKFYSQLGDWPKDWVGKLILREIVFYTDSLQIIVSNDQTFCPISEDEFTKIVQSMIAGLPITALPSPTILKVDEIYENQVYKFRFRYPATFDAFEPGLPYGSLLFVVVGPPRIDPNVYNPLLTIQVMKKTEKEFISLHPDAKKQKEIILGGRPASIYIINTVGFGSDTIVVAENNELLYVISLSSNDRGYLYGFEKIIESFEFTSSDSLR